MVAELLSSGSVVERSGRPGASGRGRPANLLSVAGADAVVVGIDFGHRHVRVALGDGTRRILGEELVEVDVDRHASDALDGAADLLASLLTHIGVKRDDIRAGAAGIPGPIDAANPSMRPPSILASWAGLDLREELRARIGVPMAVDNDANCGALGELEFGAGRGHRDFVYIKASHGIGAGVIIDGRVYRGASGTAGEIGHTQVDPNGQWCRCGNRGCLETIVSIDVVRRQLGALGIDPLDGKEITHPVARKVLAESGRTVGRAIADMCNLLDPGMVILGGDLSVTGRAFVDGVRDSIERLAQPGASTSVAVLTAELGRRSELLGALASALAKVTVD